MATFRSNEADKYSSGGSTEFFSLKNDKDTAVVRFLYNELDDILGYSLHKVEVNGKDRYVNCLREYNDPVTACPLCNAGFPLMTKLIVELYDVNTDTVKIWERGKTFFNKLASLCSRYKPLVATEFEIERNGKKGDTSTTYEIFPIPDSEKATIEDFIDDENAPVILGGFILDKTFEELEEYIETGAFPDDLPKPRTAKRTTARDARDEVAEEEPEEEPEERPRRRTAQPARKETKTPPVRRTSKRSTTERF